MDKFLKNINKLWNSIPEVLQTLIGIAFYVTTVVLFIIFLGWLVS